jgi:hypothetical protein
MVVVTGIMAGMHEGGETGRQEMNRFQSTLVIQMNQNQQNALIKFHSIFIM